MASGRSTSASRVHSGLSAVTHWPPLVYVIAGTACGIVWALGTSVQVLTSEAWLMGWSMSDISYNAYGQLFDAFMGRLPSSMYVPFMFGWGVQFALIVTSLGIELPKHPRWRWWLAMVFTIGLLIVNACGDYASSVKYGTYGQWGFTLVVFFVTFCMGYWAISAFKHAWDVGHTGSTGRSYRGVSAVAHWPPLVYIVTGVLCLAIWSLGTSTQVLTSESWIMKVDLGNIGFSAFGQLRDALTGRLPADMWQPFIFGWGVQFALIMASIGIELPRHSIWTWCAAWALTVVLLIINACGDFASASSFHLDWYGQWGFTLVVFFVTFCIGLFAVQAFKNAWDAGHI